MRPSTSLLILLLWQLSGAYGKMSTRSPGAPAMKSDAFSTSETTTTSTETTTTSVSSETSTTSSSSAVHIRDLVHPERLQPWWLLVISNNAFFVMQKAVFGFDLKFSKPGGCSKCTRIFKPVVSLVLTFMALCVWRSNLALIHALPSELGGIQRLLMLLVIWVVSPNYRAAKSFFTSLEKQSPLRLLNPRLPTAPLTKREDPCDFLARHAERLKMLMDERPLMPQYASIPLLDVPLWPWSARWFPWHKWIYMFVLCPYILPDKIFALFLPCALCSHCGCAVFSLCCTAVGHVVCCICCLIPVICTLGLWAAVNQDLSYHFKYLWPIVQMVGIHVWGQVVPILLRFCFAVVLHKQCLRVIPDYNMTACDLFLTMASSEVDLSQSTGQKDGLFQMGQRRLAQLQEEVQGENMEPDFGKAWAARLKAAESGSELQTARGFELQVEDGSASDRDRAKSEIGLQVVKYLIVGDTLQALMWIPLSQIFVIYVARVVRSPLTFDAYTQTIRDTIDERSMSQYVQYVAEKVSSTRTQFSIKMAILWNLL